LYDDPGVLPGMDPNACAGYGLGKGLLMVMAFHGEIFNLSLGSWAGQPVPVYYQLTTSIRHFAQKGKIIGHGPV
jgi:hypothetical protein